MIIVIKNILIFLIFITNAPLVFSQETIKINNPNKNEEFESFLYKFCSDSVFQICRIKFPLEYVTLNYDTYEEIKTTIEKKDWRMDYLFMNEEKRSQIYDNFSLSLKDTDERVFCWHGVENGINVLYFFKRIQRKWYLIKFEDTST